MIEGVQRALVEDVMTMQGGSSLGGDWYVALSLGEQGRVTSFRIAAKSPTRIGAREAR